MPRGTKWGVAKPTEVDGIKFASKLEAKRYGELKLLERANVISQLRVHPRFPLIGAQGPLTSESGRALEYVADFDYIEGGKLVIIDTKGVITRDFVLKRALMKQRGLTITLVTR